MFTLAITDKHGSIVDEGTFEEGEILVGRSEGADVVLPSDNVSRKHARIYTVDGRCYVEDLGSSNGVFVNGRRIHEAFQIEASAQIKVGDFYILVQTAVQDDGVFGRLRGKNLEFADETYEINEKVMLVGRGKDCGLTFVDGSISRAHAKFTVDPSGSIILEDLNSSNGTFVNDEGIQVTTLKDGDFIRFGNAEFDFSMAASTTSEEVAAGWNPPKRKSRKGLWITVSIVVILLAASAVLLAVFADDLFGGGEDQKKLESDKTAQLEEQERLGKEAEEERKEEIDELRGKAQKFQDDRKWDAAEKTWLQVQEKLGGGDKKIGEALNQIKKSKHHKDWLKQASDLRTNEKPGEAAKILRDRILRSRIKTPYMKDAQALLDELMNEELRHKIAELGAIRGGSCNKQLKRLKFCDTILLIDPKNEKTKETRKKAMQNKQRIKGCK
jgi:pSer/pThr/pTyr-binding forkhead associated (FHA) protein